MAVGIKDAFGVTGGVAADSTLKALRVTSLPLTPLAANRVAARVSGVTTIASSGCVFSLRNTSSVNVLVIRRIGLGFVTTTGFTAGQELAWGVKMARSFSAADSAGTSIAPSGNNGKKRTSLQTPSATEIRVCTASAVTAGTRTLDANHMSITAGFAATTTVGTVITPAIDNMWDMTNEDYPLVIGQNEGFIIENLVTMGAAGVGTLVVGVGYDEYLLANYNG